MKLLHIYWRRLTHQIYRIMHNLDSCIKEDGILMMNYKYLVYKILKIFKINRDNIFSILIKLF